MAWPNATTTMKEARIILNENIVAYLEIEGERQAESILNYWQKLEPLARIESQPAAHG